MHKSYSSLLNKLKKKKKKNWEMRMSKLILSDFLSYCEIRFFFFLPKKKEIHFFCLYIVTHPLSFVSYCTLKGWNALVWYFSSSTHSLTRHIVILKKKFEVFLTFTLFYLSILYIICCPTNEKEVTKVHCFSLKFDWCVVSVKIFKMKLFYF